MFGRGLYYDFQDDYDYDYDESDGDHNYESDDSYTSSRLLGKSIEEASFHIEEGPFRIKNHVQGPKLLAELASQRQNGEFLDVVVEVEGIEFPCHRAVLASTPYFKTMLSSNFAESSSNVVHLHETDSSSFSKILEFLYTGEISISKDDVQDVLQTAHMLQFDKILQYCQKFIQDNLCPNNCLGVLRLADMYGDLSDLKKSARTMAVSNFSEATQDEEFLSLSLEDLLDLLRDDDLTATTEDDVVNSVIRWLNHAPENRQTAILKILPEIRLSCVKVSLLRKLESHPAIRDSAECLAKITAAIERHTLGTQVQEEEARSGVSDKLAIIVGGWKAVNKPHLHNNDESEPLSVQPSPGPLQSMICLDPDKEQYYHIANLPTSVNGYMSVASAEGYLYVTGGRENPLVDGEGPKPAPSKQAFRYHFPSDTWLRLPVDMPVGRAGHQSVVVDGKLFLVGGGSDGDAEATSLVTMDCYDPKEGAWIKVPLRPTIHTSSDLTVTAFGDKVVFITVTPTESDGLFNLCVHSFDVKTNGWRKADTRFGNAWAQTPDVFLPTSANHKLYIRAVYTSAAHYSEQYIFDDEEETLNRDDTHYFEDDFLRAQREYHYIFITNGQEIVDTISNYASGNNYYPKKRAPLPFALFGQSFLETQKSCVGWYCRDLAVLEEEDEQERLDEA
ncbi:kelch-like protein 24 [Branchiostoma floridae]|uniref:Kelch-like protein 24 n=2 Tax=Branchiostoma floridae TaxID=7739 RepID=A0A9J7L6M7_BRAFL|nr:kelch-like protein 24 [Branchiostoma floridae]